MAESTFSEDRYEKLLEEIFVRFPSVQKASFADAYKPGLEGMSRFALALGNPHDTYYSIHIAGTNGKGSVANLLASAFHSCGAKVGLYTSPHILDFRERMRVDGRMPSKEWVYSFLCSWKKTMDELDLSFFEITTGMAMAFFAEEGVDIAVFEVGLGGRLDSTNIIRPLLSIVTSIGLDHMDILGDTRAKIAEEKAGIFKRGVPALCGEKDPETEPVFREVAERVQSPLYFVQDFRLDQGWREDLLSRMDLRGPYQGKNLSTVLCARDLLLSTYPDNKVVSLLGRRELFSEGMIHTARDMDFHGRWEKVGSNPDIICDIGHNSAALRENFDQLRSLLEKGEYSSLYIVYAVMADKDLGAILPLMPLLGRYYFCTPATRRSLPSGEILERVVSYRRENSLPEGTLLDCGSVERALERAIGDASRDKGALVYVGGSNFAVAEARALLLGKASGTTPEKL